jgi:rSAM/selenodomain-associated transferase 1
VVKPNVTLLVLAKVPVPGRVKTRLCPPCTPIQAAALAAAALHDTLDVVAATPATARVLVLDGPADPWARGRRRDGIQVRAQTGGGLDERLAHAFSQVAGPALLIGMDTPQLTVELLERATQALLEPRIDAVIGPASDGGWWGIGLRRPDPGVFIGVEMSTPRTGRLQQARLARLGLHTRVLDELRDVDRYDDAIHVAAQVPRSRFARTLARMAPQLGGAEAVA